MIRDDTNQDLLACALAETRYHLFPGGRKKIELLLRVLTEARPSRVLDVGCGNGGLTFPIAALGFDVVGADLDMPSIDHCRSSNRFRNAQFVHTDGTLREVDGRFDLVVCSEVLEHLEEPDSLISALAAKLAPAGRIFITIPNGYGPREVGGRVEQWLRKAVGLERPLKGLRRLLGRGGMPSEDEKYTMHTSNTEQGHIQKFTRKDIVQRLRTHRLEVLRWTNSFVILSVLYCRSGLSPLEKLDCWAADRLPAAFASGWYIECVPLQQSSLGLT